MLSNRYRPLHLPHPHPPILAPTTRNSHALICEYGLTSTSCKPVAAEHCHIHNLITWLISNIWTSYGTMYGSYSECLTTMGPHQHTVVALSGVGAAAARAPRHNMAQAGHDMAHGVAPPHSAHATSRPPASPAQQRCVCGVPMPSARLRSTRS